jgi:hypothetical protein
MCAPLARGAGLGAEVNSFGNAELSRMDDYAPAMVTRGYSLDASYIFFRERVWWASESLRLHLSPAAHGSVGERVATD